MQADKPWVLIIVALITTIGGIVAAIISVDAKRDRARLEDVVAQKEAEIQQFERRIQELEARQRTPGPASQRTDAQVTTVRHQEASFPPDHAHLASTGTDEPADSPAGVEPRKPIETYRGTSFSFDFMGCQRNGRLLSCTVKVMNLTGQSRALNLCDSKIVDDMGRSLRAEVRLGGDRGCSTHDMASDLPLALEMLAVAPSDMQRVSLVFGDTVAFRDIEVPRL